MDNTKQLKQFVDNAIIQTPLGPLNYAKILISGVVGWLIDGSTGARVFIAQEAQANVESVQKRFSQFAAIHNCDSASMLH